MDVNRLIYGRILDEDFFQWRLAGSTVQMWMYWQWGTIECPDWRVI